MATGGDRIGQERRHKGILASGRIKCSEGLHIAFMTDTHDRSLPTPAAVASYIHHL